MKNNHNELKNHLFAALERLNDESLKLEGERLEDELKKTKMITLVAERLLRAEELEVTAIQTMHELGMDMSEAKLSLLGDGNA